MEKTKIKKWLASSRVNLSKILDPSARIILFAEYIGKTTSEFAHKVLYTMITRTHVTRNPDDIIITNCAMLALMFHHWSDEHRNDTYEKAMAKGDTLTGKFLYSIGNDDDDKNNFNEQKTVIPQYLPDRQLTLGERRELAGKTDRKTIGKAIYDPHPMVVTKLLNNPYLTQGDALKIASRRPSQPQPLHLMSVNHRWRRRPRILQALILNPHLPLGCALSILPILNTAVIMETKDDRHLNIILRLAAQKLLELKSV